jgi:hypothetical protein
MWRHTSDGRWLGWRKTMSKWTIRACAVTVTAVAMVTVAAAPASARRIAESTIRKECKMANNGTYQTAVVTRIDGVPTRLSSCTYRDISGNRYTDYYQDGEYYDTRDAPRRFYQDGEYYDTRDAPRR